METIILFGASGHAKVVLDILQINKQYQAGYFLDDDENLHGQELMGVTVLGGDDRLDSDQLSGMRGLVCIGDNKIRQSVSEALQSTGHSLVNALHPAAIIAESVQLGAGIVVMASAVINPDAAIGDNSIINTAATVDHDCIIGSHVHIAPGCIVCGHVQVGDGVLIGAGSTITPMVKIGAGAVVGAGATVLCDVKAGETVVGTPARPAGK